jgi:formylglycine-generating enzyme required for sulfatase activity
MAGNVWEWVNDWYSESYYQNSSFSNPLGPDSGQLRVLRGGSWADTDISLRVTHRFTDYPDHIIGNAFGFRCAKEATP